MSHENQLGPNENHLAPQFIDALNSVDQFNNKNASLSSALVGMMHMFIDKPEENEVSRAEEAEMERELVRMLQADELASMGIMLFDSQQPGIKEFTKPEDSSVVSVPSGLVTFITDADKFTDTVRHLNPTEEEQPKVTAQVSSLLNTMGKLVNQGYSYEPEDGDIDSHEAAAVLRIADDQLELFAQIAPALVETEILGENNPAFDRITEYAVRRQEGILAEYIAANNQNLLAGDDRFGPGAWTMDMTGDLFVERWTSALDLLKSLRGKTEQSSFYDELVTKLVKDFEQSKIGLDQQYGDMPRMSLEAAKSVNAYYKQKSQLAQQLNEKNGKWPSDEDLTQAGLPAAPAIPGFEKPNGYIASLVEAIDVVEHMWEADFALERSFIQE